MPVTRMVLSILVLLTPGIVPEPLAAQRFRPGRSEGVDRYGVPGDTTLFMAILQAENERGRTREGMSAILAGLEHEDADIRIVAARAVGRLERSNLVPSLVPLLTDPDAAVRVEAVNAIGQAVFNRNTELATRTLMTRLELETDPGVKGTIVQTLGRLPYISRDRWEAAEHAMLLASGTIRGEALLSAARGWHRFVSRRDRPAGLSDGTIALLRTLAEAHVDPESSRGNRERDRQIAADTRQLGIAATILAGGADHQLLATALGDESWQVRREAAVGVAVLDSLPSRAELTGRALTDEHFSVRLEGVRAYARHLAPESGCDPLLQAEGDSVAHVSLAAIDALAACGAEAAGRLAAIADEPWTALDWHRPAHALVALATAAPELARGRLLRSAASDVRWVRMYAARAAGLLEAEGLLEQLAADPDGNVREAAIRGLSAVSGHTADPIYLSNVETDDYNVLITAAGALKGSLHPQAVPRLIRWLGVVTAARRETSRDARQALIERIDELGDAQYTDALRPFLRDFDPVVARAVAETLTRWNGIIYDAAPEPLPPTPFPSLDELRRTSPPAELRLQMRRGGEIVLRPLPWEAPTNVVRTFRLALAHYFDGLTFHRVVPNFVIQGGSPAANEYVGDGPFTRDELGLRSHSRGTVGISTRGRDTGDGQIFINLVDNPRLDHNYTIVAEVIDGMDVVDAVLEGDVIERVRVQLR